MRKGGGSTPSYAKTSFDSDLWGSSTDDKKGLTYSAPTWANNTMGTIGGNLNSTLQSMVNNDFTKDANFQAYQNQFNKQMTDTYNNSVLNNLANRGLMRSSGLQAANNAFADTLADNQLNLYDNYYNRLGNNLANMLNTSNTLYNYMTGVTGTNLNKANAVNGFNQRNAQIAAQNAASNNALYGQLANAVGSAAASAAPMLLAASDEKVKENIKKIGEKNGFNWYEFEYKDGYGLPKGKHEGVIAQEVEKVNPDAVIEENGIKKVDYAKLGLENEVK